MSKVKPPADGYSIAPNALQVYAVFTFKGITRCLMQTLANLLSEPSTLTVKGRVTALRSCRHLVELYIESPVDNPDTYQHFVDFFKLFGLQKISNMRLDIDQLLEHTALQTALAGIVPETKQESGSGDSQENTNGATGEQFTPEPAHNEVRLLYWQSEHSGVIIMQLDESNPDNVAILAKLHETWPAIDEALPPDLDGTLNQRQVNAIDKNPRGDTLLFTNAKAFSRLKGRVKKVLYHFSVHIEQEDLTDAESVEYLESKESLEGTLRSRHLSSSLRREVEERLKKYQ